MKGLFIMLLILFIGHSSQSQNLTILRQHWFTRNLEEFYVGDLLDTAVALPKVYQKTCYLIGDTIFLHASYSRLFGGGLQDTITESKRYDILKLARDTLVLRMPIRYSETERRVDTFYSERALVAKKFNFDSLLLNYTDNYLMSKEAKVFSVIVRSNGEIIYKGVHNTKPYLGLYKGMLHAGMFSKMKVDLVS